MTEVNLRQLARTMEGLASVAVGFGVLGYQRAQVVRRELQRRFSLAARGPAGSTRPAPPPLPATPSAAQMAGEALGRLAPVVYSMAPVAAYAAERASRYAAERASERIAPLVAEAAGRAGETAERLKEAATHLPPEAQDVVAAAGDLVKDLPGEAKELAKEAISMVRLALQMVAPPPPRPQGS
ncbi:MAG TPA: hypothetical protein VME20_13320 [Acidimicrobiales bacterium]|nr:hypothetical protein [Acidimicrobiales bacterium]